MTAATPEYPSLGSLPGGDPLGRRALAHRPDLVQPVVLRARRGGRGGTAGPCDRTAGHGGPLGGRDADARHGVDDEPTVRHGSRATRTRDENAERILRAAGLPGASFAAPPIRRWRPYGHAARPGAAHPVEHPPADLQGIRHGSFDPAGAPGLGHPHPGVAPVAAQVDPSRDALLRLGLRPGAGPDPRSVGCGSVVVYNGRFTHDRAVAAAAEQAGVRVLYYDTGGYETDFDLTDATTHDWAHLQGRHAAHVRRVGSGRARRDRVGLVHQSAGPRRRQQHGSSSRRRQRGHLEGLPGGRDAGGLLQLVGGRDRRARPRLGGRTCTPRSAALADLARRVPRRGPGHALVVRTHPHMRLKPADDLDDWMAAVDGGRARTCTSTRARPSTRTR